MNFNNYQFNKRLLNKKSSLFNYLISNLEDEFVTQNIRNIKKPTNPIPKIELKKNPVVISWLIKFSIDLVN